jgi:hypothetical protein
VTDSELFADRPCAGRSDGILALIFPEISEQTGKRVGPASVSAHVSDPEGPRDGDQAYGTICNSLLGLRDTFRAKVGGRARQLAQTRTHL